MLTCVLQRVLPFTLTLFIGAALGNFINWTVARTGKMFDASAPSTPSYAYKGCRASRYRNDKFNGSFDDSSIYTASELTQRAVMLSKPEPLFSEEARQNNVAGVVKLRMVLASSGEVTNVSVIKGLPDGLTENAIAAARQIRFMPAQINGRPVSQWVTVEYSFNIF